MKVSKILKNKYSISIVFLFATACFRGPGFFQKAEDSSPAVEIMIQDKGEGVYGGAYNPLTRGSQTLSITGGELSGSSITFLPGALNIPTSISIEAGAGLLSGYSMNSISNGAALSEGGPAISISAQPAANSSSPMSLQIPLSSSASFKFALGEIYVLVIFKVRDEATGEIKMGMLPTSDVKVSGNVIKFNTTRFGVFQAVYSDRIIPAAIEVVTDSPIITKRIENKLAAVAWQVESPVSFTESGIDGFRLSGSLSGAGALRDCGYLLADSAGGAILYRYWIKASGGDPARLAAISRGERVSIFIEPRYSNDRQVVSRFVCEETGGRVLESPFSQPFLLPKISATATSTFSLAPFHSGQMNGSFRVFFDYEASKGPAELRLLGMKHLTGAEPDCTTGSLSGDLFWSESYSWTDLSATTGLVSEQRTMTPPSSWYGVNRFCLQLLSAGSVKDAGFFGGDGESDIISRVRITGGSVVDLSSDEVANRVWELTEASYDMLTGVCQYFSAAPDLPRNSLKIEVSALGGTLKASTLCNSSGLFSFTLGKTSGENCGSVCDSYLDGRKGGRRIRVTQNIDNNKSDEYEAIILVWDDENDVIGIANKTTLHDKITTPDADTMYVLSNNIDLTGWVSIDANGFFLDGNDYLLTKLDLTLSPPAGTSAGLIKNAQNSIFSNFHFVDPHLKLTPTGAIDGVGTLIGNIDNTSGSVLIYDVSIHVLNNLKATIDLRGNFTINNVGGLVGNAGNHWDVYLQEINVEDVWIKNNTDLGTVSSSWGGVLGGGAARMSNIVVENLRLEAGGTGIVNQVGGVAGSLSESLKFATVMGLDSGIPAQPKSAITGRTYVGGVAGIVGSSGSISRSAVSAAKVQGYDNVGGMMGKKSGFGTIEKTYVAENTLVSLDSGSAGRLGGFVGFAYQNSTYQTSYSRAKINCLSGQTCGSFAGWIDCGNAFTKILALSDPSLSSTGTIQSFWGATATCPSTPTPSTFLEIFVNSASCTGIDSCTPSFVNFNSFANPSCQIASGLPAAFSAPGEWNCEVGQPPYFRWAQRD